MRRRLNYLEPTAFRRTRYSGTCPMSGEVRVPVQCGHRVAPLFTGSRQCEHWSNSRRVRFEALSAVLAIMRKNIPSTTNAIPITNRVLGSAMFIRRPPKWLGCSDCRRCSALWAYGSASSKRGAMTIATGPGARARCTIVETLSLAARALSRRPSRKTTAARHQLKSRGQCSCQKGSTGAETAWTDVTSITPMAW